MAETFNTVGGRFLVKFGTMRVVASDASVSINPVTHTATPASDGVYFTESPRESSATLTLIITQTTDMAALLAYRGDVKIKNLTTGTIHVIFNGRIQDGLDHDVKAGTATCSVVGSSGDTIHE